MDDGYVIRAMLPTISQDRQLLTIFLEKHHLKYEPDIQIAYGIFNHADQLLGCGCSAGNLLKCFAVEESIRGQNALGALVSRLVQDCFQQGHTQLFIVTRPKNQVLFESCGFFLVAKTPDVALLENQKNGIQRFLAPFIHEEDKEKLCGSIVMNCNPFTLGHRALAEYASAKCQLLHIFVLEEDRSFFPAKDRIRLVELGTEDLPNVQVHSGGPYMISSATFPTYFLKQDEPATELQARLDLTIFTQHIAPALGIHIRFAGEEPFDSTTRTYNQVMKEVLPTHGIRFEEIPRLKLGGEPVSASRVRRLLMEKGVTGDVCSLVPPCTQTYLKENWETLLQVKRASAI